MFFVLCATPSLKEQRVEWDQEPYDTRDRKRQSACALSALKALPSVEAWRFALLTSNLSNTFLAQ